jgi:hypothetical protein
VIKVIVFAVIGLVLGLGGGSGVAVMRAKKVAAAAHDSTAKADSTAKTKHGGEGEDSESGEKSHGTDVADHTPAPVHRGRR